jgi:hypothetical protein
MKGITVRAAHCEDYPFNSDILKTDLQACAFGDAPSSGKLIDAPAFGAL